MDQEAPTVLLPDAPAVAAGSGGAAWASPRGGCETVSLGDAAGRIERGAAPYVCHAKAAARRLRLQPFAALDVLELFAFVRPAQFCLPTPSGLARDLGLPLPEGLEAEAETLHAAARRLLEELANEPDAGARRASVPIAWSMSRARWPWSEAVLAALGAVESPHSRNVSEGLRVWLRLNEWREWGASPEPGSWPVEPVEARARLVQLRGPNAEDRPEQMDYASAASAAFAPRDKPDQPRVAVAEAGTGVGKTLGYIAPASVWAEKNDGAVWISTFTRNLQRQLDAELDKLYPDREDKGRKVVVRKGRENYFCILNYEEALERANAKPQDAVALGLMARWALKTRDGDMVGGDFPAWLGDILGPRMTMDLTDTRGECIFSACVHYRKCFVERSIRRARRASIVVANHALVMVQAAMGGDDGVLPARYVFDEGHHLFGAADSAFSAHLTGHEAAELRRWLLGAEEGTRSRSKGLRSRVGDLVAGDEEGVEALDEALRAAHALPGPAWRQRIAGGAPVGACESFLEIARRQVLARDRSKGPYSLETGAHPAIDGLLEAAAKLEVALARLARPMDALIRSLTVLLDVEAEQLDTSTRMRIESTCRTLERRGLMQIRSWRAMLDSLATETPEEFVDWFGLERRNGYEVDVGLHRHWIDPMVPFAGTLAGPAHGLLVTSASLRDEDGWDGADVRTGARHFPSDIERAAVESPFDYPARTRVFVIGDVSRDSPQQVSAAYRELFLAAGGGGLGLFTAIHRLRKVHELIAPVLEQVGLDLLAQHVDAMDTGALIDIFRAEENACILGTDAVRDGVDVPGRSLRLIVFDRVPWPRPDILHKARRGAFGGRAYDEMIVRLKLKQAFGRLVRRADDRGVFAMLDRALPSRLATAFPEGVEVRRVGLAEAVAETRAFLSRSGD